MNLTKQFQRSRLFRDREYLHLARAEVSLPDMLR